MQEEELFNNDENESPVVTMDTADVVALKEAIESNLATTGKYNTQNRTLEIAEKIMDKAKLDPKDMMPLVQFLYLGKEIASEEYKLMEVDEDQLEYLMSGKSLVLRGLEQDNAVCCTDNATYSFKVAEISNPLLLTSDLIFPDKVDQSRERYAKRTEISLITNSYFTLTKENPRLLKLKQLLECNLYMGKVEDAANEAHKYGIEYFLDTFQASEDEMYTYLNYIEAYKINDCWRLLDSSCLLKLVTAVLKLIDDNSWPFHEIPPNEIYNELSALFDGSVLKRFEVLYFRKNKDGSFELNQEKIARCFAQELFRQTDFAKRRWDSFLADWKHALPITFNIEVDFKLINDMAYVDELYVYYLNVQDMPDDLERRFKFLFEKRAKWPATDLVPYLQDICCNEVTQVNAALLKFCRPFTQNSVKYYTSRM